MTVLSQARDVEDPVYLDAINSLLISGEYPHLFSNDEMEGLLQVHLIQISNILVLCIKQRWTY